MSAHLNELTIGISTMSHRLGGVFHLIDELNQVISFIVCIQTGHPSHNEVEFQRAIQKFDKHPNLKLIVSEGTGVANSRNLILKTTETKYLWFCDDDVSINFDGLIRIIDYFSNFSDTSVLAGITALKNRKMRKIYPVGETRLTKFNSGKFGTTDIVVKVFDIQKNGIVFDNNFGAGRERFIGDEYIFLCDCLSKKLKCIFIPEITCFHEKTSSGLNDEIEGRSASERAVFKRVFGCRWFFIWIAFKLKSLIRRNYLSEFLAKF